MNIAAYRFVRLDDLGTLRERLLGLAGAQCLRGTVLLAEEGINLFLAGSAAGIEAFLDSLGQDERFTGLTVKRSLSASVPFRRLKVKIKREIIRMDCPQVRPAEGRAPSVAPRTLQRWLAQGRDDAGREVVMLDTRNAFEVERGRFAGALDWGLARFGEFPAALRERGEALLGRTVVTYCTGGIRCEKANLLMRAEGFEHVMQLDGGILQYFEDTDGAPHWQGECIVFDEREALDAALLPAPAGTPEPPGHKATQREEGRGASLLKPLQAA